MDNTGACTTAAAIVVATAATVPTAVRPPTVTVVLVLALLVPAVQVLAVLTGLTEAPDAAAGATVTFSRPAVVGVAADVAGFDATEATRPDVPAVETVAAAFAAAAAAAADDSSDATTVGDTSVSSGGLGGGVANPDQHVDGELLLDVTLLSQSRPTSTSTRVDHVVSQGDSDRVGDDETIGSSFKYRSIS